MSVGRKMPGAPPPLLADAMLGRLAKWLRLLGLDVRYEPDVSDAALVAAMNRDPGLVLLTRDAALARRPAVRGRTLRVRTSDWREQVAEVVRALDVDPVAHRWTRCLRCNAPVRPLTREEAAPRVPPHAARTATDFSWCPRCEKAYWRGSHPDRAEALLDEVLGGS